MMGSRRLPSWSLLVALTLGGGCAHRGPITPIPALVLPPAPELLVSAPLLQGSFDDALRGDRWLIEAPPTEPGEAAPYRVEIRRGEAVAVFMGYVREAGGRRFLQLTAEQLPVDQGLVVSHYAVGSLILLIEGDDPARLKLLAFDPRSVGQGGDVRLQGGRGGPVLVGDPAALWAFLSEASFADAFTLERLGAPQ